MTVYLAIQTGVYRHNVQVFSMLSKAMEYATKSITEESDHYHNYEILESSVDSPDNEKEVCELMWDRKIRAVVVKNMRPT